MTPDEMERIVAIEHEQKDLRRLIEEHVKDEEAWRLGHDEKVDKIYEVLVGAKGAAKFLSGVVLVLAAMGGMWEWIVHNLNVSIK